MPTPPLGWQAELRRRGYRNNLPALAWLELAIEVARAEVSSFRAALRDVVPSRALPLHQDPAGQGEQLSPEAEALALAEGRPSLTLDLELATMAFASELFLIREPPSWLLHRTFPGACLLRLDDGSPVLRAHASAGLSGMHLAYMLAVLDYARLQLGDADAGGADPSALVASDLAVPILRAFAPTPTAPRRAPASQLRDARRGALAVLDAHGRGSLPSRAKLGPALAEFAQLTQLRRFG